jgi:prepilin-type N-terminal cleavage/methylation domain-containing protein
MPPRGFTLLETLVALAVTAVVLAALAGAVTHAIAARERATGVADRAAALRTVLLRIAHELEAATPVDADPRTRLVVEPARDARTTRLRFAWRASEPRLVAYAVEGDALVRREASRFAPPDAPEPPGVAVLDRVRDFRVRCFDGAEWSAGWALPRLPRAVELELTVDDGSGAPEALATTVAIPLARGG